MRTAYLMARKFPPAISHSHHAPVHGRPSNGRDREVFLYLRLTSEAKRQAREASFRGVDLRGTPGLDRTVEQGAQLAPAAAAGPRPRQSCRKGRGVHA